jgi:hypothetical protein
MRLNVMGSQGFVMLTEGEVAPLDAAPEPNNIYHVTALDDSQLGTWTTPPGRSGVRWPDSGLHLSMATNT